MQQHVIASATPSNGCLQLVNKTALDLYTKHNTIEVSDPLLDDLVMLYANETLSEVEADEFIECMSDNANKAAIRLNFCHCCMAINAAMLVEDDAVFHSFVGLLELSKMDEVFLNLQKYTLRKLADDALDAVEDVASFERRVEAVSKLLVRQV